MNMALCCLHVESAKVNTDKCETNSGQRDYRPTQVNYHIIHGDLPDLVLCVIMISFIKQVGMHLYRKVNIFRSIFIKFVNLDTKYNM